MSATPSFCALLSSRLRYRSITSWAADAEDRNGEEGVEEVWDVVASGEEAEEEEEEEESVEYKRKAAVRWRAISEEKEEEEEAATAARQAVRPQTKEDRRGRIEALCSRLTDKMAVLAVLEAMVVSSVKMRG